MRKKGIDTVASIVMQDDGLLLRVNARIELPALQE
jgi:hypothetical protein